MARNIRIAGVVVDLIAESAQYIAELRRTNQATRRWSRNVSRSFDHAARNMAAMAAGYLTVSTAIGAMKKSMANAREIENMARLAQMSVGEFQALAYAADTVGVSAEKLGDMTKDVNEKLGEFIDTGGGGFKDFFEQVAPKVGLTAKELQNLSGPEVLLRMQQAMEAANVPLKQQSFYLESVANDATLLIPLLQNGGEAYYRLAQEAEDANLILSKTDISSIRESNKILSEFGKRISTSFAKGVAGAAEQIKWLGEFAGSVFEYIGTKLDAMNDAPKTLAGMIEKQAQLQEELDQVNASINLLDSNKGAYNRDSRLAALTAQAQVLKDKITEIQEQRWSFDLSPPGQPKLPDLSLPDSQMIPGLQVNQKETQKAQNAIQKANRAAIEAVQREEETFRQSNQQMLDSLQDRLGTEQELLRQGHVEALNNIQSLALTEEQVKAANYESLDALRIDFMTREVKQFDEAMAALKEKSGVSVTEATRNFQTLADMTGGSVDDIKDATTGWANDFSSSMANMVTQGKLDFSSLAESIVNDLIRIAIQATITDNIMKAFGIGGTTGGDKTTTTAKGHATGGPVTRGSTYLVGEKGPELFTASNSGSIIPNDKLGGGTVVNIYNQAGAEVESNTRQTPQGDIVEIMLKRVEGRMNEQISRGQGLAQTLEGRYSLTRNSF